MRDYPVTTEEYWSVDGYPLNQFAHNISSWGGSRQGVPPLEGEDQEMGNWAGKRWVPKNPGSRIIVLEGWITGDERAGIVRDQPLITDPKQIMRQNWYMLRKLLWTPYRQFQLTKRFYRPSDLKLIDVTADAEYSSGLEPQMIGPSGAEWEVDLLLADPFFYGPRMTSKLFNNYTLPTATVGSNLPAAEAIYVEGDYSPRSVQVNFNSNGSSNPAFVLTNQSAVNNSKLEYVTILGVQPGVDYTLDVDTGRVTSSVPGKTVSITSWSGRKMLELRPGENLVSFSGKGTITYREAWL